MDSLIPQAAASFQPSATIPWAGVSREHAVAYDPRAPRDEAQDASLSLAQSYLRDIGLFDDMVDAQTMRDWGRLSAAEAEGDRLLAKALRTVNPKAAQAKARTEALYATVGGGGFWLQKPGIPLQGLRTAAARVEVAQAIHLTWRRKVQSFGEIATRDDQVGFRIRHADPNHKPGPDEQEYANWLARFLMNGGREFRPHERRRKGQHTLRMFLPMLVDESLLLDHVPIETVPLLNGVNGLDAFYIRDGATFYLATPNNDGIYAYQSLSGLPDDQFTYEEMTIFQRNLCPDVHRRGYARSEFETSIDTMTMFLQAMEYTRQGIDNNAIPRGILTVFGQFDRRQEEAFKSAWASKMRGVGNRFGLPVLFSRNGNAAAQFTSTNADFSEMAYVKWLALQTSIMTAIYGTSPEEIHMEGFSVDHSGLGGGADTKEKLAASRDSNFVPMLSSIEALLSDDIIGRFTPDWRVQFTGLDPMETAARRAREEKVMTINELRTSLQMERHPLNWFGELPADQNLLSAEFQRLEKTMTFGEARQVWGGFKAYPNETLNAAPLNANLQAEYQSATAPQPLDNMGGDPWAQVDNGGQGDQPGGEGAEDLPEGGPGALMKARMAQMAGGDPADA